MPTPIPGTYPVPRPSTDPRFTYGLALDVAAVLHAHGFPPVTFGGDLVELQMTLFGFLYAPATGPDRSDPEPVADPITDGGGYLPCGCHGSQREHTCGPLD